MKTDNNKLPYAPPRCMVMEIETMQMIATSGYGPNSDDSEFGPYTNATQRRGTWGNLWEE